MKPFDPRLLRAVPEVRRPLAGLAGVAVLQGISTIGLAFGLTGLVVAVVRGAPLGGPAALVAGVFAVRAALGWLTETVAAQTGLTVSSAVRRDALARWSTVPADRRPVDATTMATQGASAVEPYVSRFLPSLVSAAVVPALAVGCLLVVDPLSALVVVLTLPLLPFFAALIGRATREDTERRWRSMADLAGHFVDVMRGLPTLVAYGRAERQVGVIGEVSERHRRATMRTLRTAFLSSAALELLASLSVAIVAVVVGLRLTHGDLDLRTGLLAILLAPEAYWPIRRVGQEFHNAADGAAALDRLLPPTSASRGKLTQQRSQPLLSDGTSASRGSVRGARADGIRLECVSYTYPGATRPALTGLDLHAGPGLTVLTGPSGCGKTTALDLAAGLREPTAGTVRRPSTHLVTQRPFLAAGSVRDNLTLGNHATDEELWAAVREVGLDGFVAGLPDALAARVGDDGFGLSAGQRARLVLARALLSDADAVLLDEPTAHLDDEAANAVHDVIVDLAQWRPVVVVTHRAELVELADQHVDLGAQVTR